MWMKSCRRLSLPLGFALNLPQQTFNSAFPQMANLGHDALKAVHNKEYEVTFL